MKLRIAVEQQTEDPVDPAPPSDAAQAGADRGVVVPDDTPAPDDTESGGEIEAGGATTEGGPAAISLEELEALSDRVLEAISSYYGRDGAYSRGEIECAELQAAFVEVMDSWIDYSTRGKAGWEGRLPEDLVERDERLYLGVQDVERLLEASACPRP